MAKNIRPKLKADLMVNLLIIWPPEKLLQRYVLYSRPFLFSVRFVFTRSEMCFALWLNIWHIRCESFPYSSKRHRFIYIFIYTCTNKSTLEPLTILLTYILFNQKKIVMVWFPWILWVYLLQKNKHPTRFWNTFRRYILIDRDYNPIKLWKIKGWTKNWDWIANQSFILPILAFSLLTPISII